MSIENKFYGCILGGLVGDAFGFPFELRQSQVSRVRKFFSTLDTRKEELIYTDDTAMAWNTLDSLFAKNVFDPADVAKRYAETWDNESYRIYGVHVTHVFAEWQRNNYVGDMFAAAKKPFNGTGSWGNGGAMRVSPIALYYFNDKEKMDELVLLSTKLTHTNPLGYVGALVQCWAVRIALDLDPNQKFSSSDFIDKLIDRVNHFADEKAFAAKKCFRSDLERLKTFLQTKHEASVTEVVDAFGNEEIAHRSVVTAIFCFLRSIEWPRESQEVDNPFVRTIMFACCLGNDTDTIACMAGSIAGSYFGVSGIPENFPRLCEGFEHGKELANKLLERITLNN